MADNTALQEQLDRIERNSILSGKQVLTMDDTATLTGLSKSYLYKLTCKGEIPHYKPNGKFIYYDKTEIETWLKRNRIASNNEIEAKAELISRRV